MQQVKIIITQTTLTQHKPSSNTYQAVVGVVWWHHNSFRIFTLTHQLLPNQVDGSDSSLLPNLSRRFDISCHMKNTVEMNLTQNIILLLRGISVIDSTQGPSHSFPINGSQGMKFELAQLEQQPLS